MKLSLRFGLSNFERFTQRKNNELFKKVRADVLHRDQFTCQYCFYPSQELEVVNADNDYSNNKPTNLVSACELCAQCMLLDAYAMDYSGQDKIIYLPEMTQEQLNQACRLLFCKMAEEGEVSYNAKRMFAKLQDRAGLLNEKSGFELSRPQMYALYLHQARKDSPIFQQLRWLPAPDSYTARVAIWQDEIANLLS